MSEPTVVTPAVDLPKPPAADANGQLIVSLATVIILGALGGGLILAGMKTEGAAILGSIVGALANSLNSPTGIGNVIRGAATVPAKP